jgi:hypothetical protein
MFQLLVLHGAAQMHSSITLINQCSAWLLVLQE